MGSSSMDKRGMNLDPSSCLSIHTYPAGIHPCHPARDAVVGHVAAQKNGWLTLYLCRGQMALTLAMHDIAHMRELSEQLISGLAELAQLAAAIIAMSGREAWSISDSSVAALAHDATTLHGCLC